MIELAPLEERLALFAEGIAGRYLHIRPLREFAGRRVVPGDDGGTLTPDTVYLPERLPSADAGAYRVLVLQQLCRAEFGSYSLNAAAALSSLATPRQPPSPALLGTRASEFERFFANFAHPALIAPLFWLCEQVRVDALMVARYPGINRHLTAWQAAWLDRHPPELIWDLPSALLALDALAHGVPPTVITALDATNLLAEAVTALVRLAQEPGDVQQSATIAATIHDLLAPLVQADSDGPGAAARDEDADAANWMQREARLDDWDDELAGMDALLSVENLTGERAEVGAGDGMREGELRPNDIELRQLQGDRDTLARRIDMERSAIRDALGASRGNARSYRYDEWDYHNRRYLPRWCRLFEERLEPDPDADLATLQAAIRAHRHDVQKRLEQIKPLGYQRVHRQADGDELDFNALIQARQDVRAGRDPDERVYSRRDRTHRDVCAVFLVDLSASTDDPVDPPPPEPYEEDDDPFMWGRAAPGTVDTPLEPDEPPPRRIIDVQREAMLVMSAALEQLGDSYGVYGFSGYGRDCVEMFVAKEPDERFSRATLAAIAGMKPKRSTRMGPAIRHSVRKLVESGNALKVLLIISDGFPQDCDYGPDRGEHEYGVQDTAKALREAHDKGIETFCVTVDRSGHDYLKRMCPEARYLVIEEIEDLPEQLTKVYQALTA